MSSCELATSPLLLLFSCSHIWKWSGFDFFFFFWSYLCCTNCVYQISSGFTYWQKETDLGHICLQSERSLELVLLLASVQYIDSKYCSLHVTLHHLRSNGHPLCSARTDVHPLQIFINRFIRSKALSEPRRRNPTQTWEERGRLDVRSRCLTLRHRAAKKRRCSSECVEVCGNVLVLPIEKWEKRGGDKGKDLN